MRLSGSSREYELHQWANDWLSVDPMSNPHEPRGKDAKLKPGIISPLRVLLNTEECERMREDRTRAFEQIGAGQTPTTGLFWKAWGLRTVRTTAGNEIGFFVALGRGGEP